MVQMEPKRWRSTKRAIPRRERLSDGLRTGELSSFSREIQQRNRLIFVHLRLMRRKVAANPVAMRTALKGTARLVFVF